MFSRYVFAFCFVLFITAVANVTAQEDEEDYFSFENNLSFENLNIVSQIEKARETLMKFFRHATEECIVTALKDCRRHWFNNNLIKCAEDLFIVKNVACIFGPR